MSKYFGTDGFRGEAGITLTADHAYKVGRFLGWYYNALRERNGGWVDCFWWRCLSTPCHHDPVRGVHRSRGYRSVPWGTSAKENVWKDSLFRMPRRICGTRKTPY